MSGTNVVFDTNALINFFNGHPALQQYINSSLFISVLSIIEFLSYPKITQADKIMLFQFLKNVKIVDLRSSDTTFIQQISTVRSNYKIKLPDAVIAATALSKNAILVTNDRDFTKIISLTVSTY